MAIDLEQELVCPRCGDPVEDDGAFCRNCGLNLQAQDELPTAEHYAAVLREGGRPAFKGDSARSSNGVPTGLAIAVAVLALIVVGGAIGAVIASTQSDSPQLVDPATFSRAASRSGSGGVGPYGSRASNSAIVESVIERHWRNIEQGRLSEAYSDFASSLRTDPDVGSRSKWVSGQRADPIRSVSISVKAANAGKNTADVKVLRLKTVARDSGCKIWTGTYAMKQEGDRWRIAEAPLQSKSC